MLGRSSGQLSVCLLSCLLFCIYCSTLETIDISLPVLLCGMFNISFSCSHLGARGCSRCSFAWMFCSSKVSLHVMFWGSGKHSWGFPQIYTPPNRISAEETTRKRSLTTLCYRIPPHLQIYNKQKPKTCEYTVQTPVQFSQVILSLGVNSELYHTII